MVLAVWVLRYNRASLDNEIKTGSDLAGSTLIRAELQYSEPAGKAEIEASVDDW
jgi:hypothetical protein